MKPKYMAEIYQNGHHECCPKDWRKVPNLTGDYDLDATIMHRENGSLPSRLSLYTRRNTGNYGPRSAYNGYSGYHGDD